MEETKRKKFDDLRKMKKKKIKFLPPAVLKLPADNCLCNCKVLAVAILLERYQDSSIDNPGLELLMFTIFAVEASPDVDICDELRLDKEARTGL